MINLPRNKNICRGLKKVVAKSKAQVYFEQQISVLLLVFHKTHNLSRNKFDRTLANQPISAPHFRVKLIAPGEKRETSTKTCNETMLHDKLRVFCISCFAALRLINSRAISQEFQTVTPGRLIFDLKTQLVAPTYSKDCYRAFFIK